MVVAIFQQLVDADSFVYLTVAQSTVYESDTVSGLREVAPSPETVVQIAGYRKTKR